MYVLVIVDNNSAIAIILFNNGITINKLIVRQCDTFLYIKYLPI